MEKKERINKDTNNIGEKKLPLKKKKKLGEIFTSGKKIQTGSVVTTNGMCRSQDKQRNGRRVPAAASESSETFTPTESRRLFKSCFILYLFLEYIIIT